MTHEELTFPYDLGDGRMVQPDAWTHTDWIALANAASTFLVGVAVVFATFYGPILAARGADTRAEKAARRADRMSVFRQLMGHRFDVLNPNFVVALNLVPIEFADSKNCLSAFDAFLDAYHPKTSARSDCADVRRKATIRLLAAVGKDLGYELEQLDLMEQVYAPQSWVDDAEKGRKIREMLGDIADGKKALPVLAVLPPAVLVEDGADNFAIRTAPKSPRR